VYSRNEMRLLISVLVVALSAANSGDALMCAAYCVSSASAGSAASHHHQMQSQPKATSARLRSHTHHRGVDCSECPPKSGSSLNQNSGCTTLVKIQALKEGSFSLGTLSGAAQGLAETPTDGRALACHCEQSVFFEASPTIKSTSPPSLPLRI
jgi:hypothetical protein